MDQTKTEETTVTTSTSTETSIDSNKPAEKEADTSREENTVIVPRVRERRRNQRLAYAFIGLCGVVAAASLVHACKSSKNDSTADTTVMQTVFSNTAPRKFKLADASKCRRDQIRIVGDTLVTDSDCTVITYDDGK